MRLKSTRTKRLVKPLSSGQIPLLNETMLVHRAISLAISAPGDSSLYLAVKRPLDDPDFPGEWGIPACTLLVDETIEHAIERIGKSKLGVSLDPGPVLGDELQRHPSRALHMELHVATLHDPTVMIHLSRSTSRCNGKSASTLYTEWQWAPPTIFARGASLGSLCCQLLLRAVSRNT